MLVNSQFSEINNREDTYSFSNGNRQNYNNQETSAFQQQVNEIRNEINNRKNKTIADCLGFQPTMLSSSAQHFKSVSMSQERGQQQYGNNNINHNHNCIQQNYNNGNNQVRFSEVINLEQRQPYVVVEQGTRSLKKNQYESELRNLRKTNNNLENRLSDLKDFNNNVKSIKSNLVNKSFSKENEDNNVTLKKKPISSSSSIQMNKPPLSQNNIILGVDQYQKNNQQQSTPQVSNLYDNQQMLAKMVNTVSNDARKQALQKQEDGEEVKQLKEQRNKEEERRLKITNDLESENVKLKNKAIRAQYEAENIEEQMKQLDNEKFNYHKDVKNKIRDVKTKENEMSLLLQKKAKIEADITSTRLLLKDREAEIIRQSDKFKINATERTKTLRDLELNIQKRNIARLDYEKIRQDRDRIMEEMEKRQVDANDKYNIQQQKYLNNQNEIQSLQKQITTLDNHIEEEKKEIQKLKMANKILLEKQEDMYNLERKLRKKEKTILSLESELELVRREKKIEIVEKIVEKPVVIEKPVIVEKEVVIKEEVKIDEPLERELKILREELSLLDNGLKEKTSEAEYWKKRYQDSEIQNKQNIGLIQDTHHSERQNMKIQYEKGIQEIQTLQSKMNALLAEVHQLSNINISKNREVQDQLHQLINNNQSLENIIVANSYHTIPQVVQIPISSRYQSYQ